ncbi:hypothetical protein Tco_0700301, partial [Tanacetum coccineum]
MNHQTSSVPQVIPQVAYQSPPAPTQLMTESPFVDSGFVVPVFSPGDDPIACLNKAMAFLTDVASLRGVKGKIILVLRIRAMILVQGEILQVDMQKLLNAITAKVKDIWLGNALSLSDQGMQRDPRIPAAQAQTIIPHNAAFQTEDLDTYDSDCDDLSTAQAVLMANISNYSSDIISEVPNSETYLNDMDNQSVHALQDFEQSPDMDFIDNEISSDSNIIPYSQYLQETQQATVQDTNLQAQQDSMILSVIEQMSEQMINHKAQQIKPTLYDGVVMSNAHVAMLVIDDEETLILEEESRSKMSEKAKDPEVIAKKISDKPIDYEKLNRLTKDFGKCFSPQQELLAEQAFWFHILNPTIKPPYTPPVLVDVPSELPKVSLVNASLKKLKFHLTQFDSVVKKRTTPNALEEDVLFTVMNSMSLNNDYVNMEMQKCESYEKCLNLDAELSKSKQAYNDLLKNYSQLEKHCISLEASMQLQQEVFQNDESCVNQNVVKIQEYFEINDLKARIQDKDKTICKFKDTIKSLRENTKEENVNPDKCDLEPINKELENSVTRVRHKEQSDSLINKLNLKSVENEDLRAQIQDKVFVITSLKNDLRKLKGNEIVENVVHTHSATTIAPGMFKLDLEPLPPRLLQNREVHIDYLRNTQEQANILQEIVEQAQAKQPLDNELDFACKYAIRIQELLGYVQDTCPNVITPSAKKVTVKPMNNVKKVSFVEPFTSLSNIKQVESSNTSDSNTLVLSSTGVKCFTSNFGSKPPGNKRNERISQTPSRNKKNKVEAQPRKVKKVDRVVKPVCDVDVKHSLANSEILCDTCNKSMFDGVHDKCLLDLVQNRNKCTKSTKKHKKQNVWKPTSHVFTEVGFKWKPIGRTFTIVGNSCPLTRITSTNVVQIVLWYLDSGCSKHMTGNRSHLVNFVSKFMGTVRFGNDQIARIMGYSDYQLGNVIISRVYYVEGLG